MVYHEKKTMYEYILGIILNVLWFIFFWWTESGQTTVMW